MLRVRQGKMWIRCTVSLCDSGSDKLCTKSLLRWGPGVALGYLGHTCSQQRVTSLGALCGGRGSNQDTGCSLGLGFGVGSSPIACWRAAERLVPDARAPGCSPAKHLRMHLTLSTGVILLISLRLLTCLRMWLIWAKSAECEAGPSPAMLMTLQSCSCEFPCQLFSSQISTPNLSSCRWRIHYMCLGELRQVRVLKEIIPRKKVVLLSLTGGNSTKGWEQSCFTIAHLWMGGAGRHASPGPSPGGMYVSENAIRDGSPCVSPTQPGQEGRSTLWGLCNGHCPSAWLLLWLAVCYQLCRVSSTLILSQHHRIVKAVTKHHNYQVQPQPISTLTTKPWPSMPQLHVSWKPPGTVTALNVVESK